MKNSDYKKTLGNDQNFIEILTKKILGKKLTKKEEKILIAHEKEIQNIAGLYDTFFGAYFRNVLGEGEDE